MEQINECFTKFFLSQAVEIKPATIQALIDQGFTTKLSLVCLDLVHDLPNIELENLSQRAILRKYLVALQENCPFQLCINETESTGQQQAVPVVNAKASKKRKHEAFLEDMDYNDGGDDHGAGNIAGFSSVTSPVSLAYGAPSYSRQPKVSTPTSSPVAVSTPPKNIINETFEMPEKKPKGKGKKAEVPRSKSQIRYHMEKERQSLAASQAPTLPDISQPNDDEMADPTIVDIPQAKKPSKKNIITRPDVPIPTPAAKALLAKIEEKNQTKGSRKATRARK